MKLLSKKTILNKNLLNKTLLIGCLAASFAATGFAAIIPPGVQLHATQTLIRNNGSEPETLDPALAE